MAKTATDIPITQGSGVNLSNFALASGRRRQTVILADADDSGEALVAELPAHDSVDRGSPIKIGGRASASPLTAVQAADRTDAWLTLNGQQTAVNTVRARSGPTTADVRGVGSQLFRFDRRAWADHRCRGRGAAQGSLYPHRLVRPSLPWAPSRFWQVAGVPDDRPLRLGTRQLQRAAYGLHILAQHRSEPRPLVDIQRRCRRPSIAADLGITAP